MRTILGLVITVVAMAFVGAVAPAAAQTTDTSASPAVGRVELGANGSAFFGGCIGAVAAGPQLTVNFSRRDAIQVGVDVKSDRSGGFWRVEGPYLAAYRRTFSDLPNGRVFVLIGAAGWLSASHHDEYSDTSPAHVTTRNGVTTTVDAKTYHSPAYTHVDASAPRVAVVGIGAEGHVASRMVLQGQLVLGGTIEAVFMRASAALVVPLGRVER